MSRKTGYLTKQGAVWKSWKNRFFMLFDNGFLLYFQNSSSTKAQGGLILFNVEISWTSENILTLKTPLSYTVRSSEVEEVKGRAFYLKGDMEELMSWENAIKSLKSSLENSPPSSPRCAAPPFLPFEENSNVSTVSSPQNTGLSLSGQRSVSDNELTKDFHLEKISRILGMDDILIVVEWLSFKKNNGVEEKVGYIVYNQMLGSISDNICKCDLQGREELKKKWTKPNIRFKDSNVEKPKVEFSEGELLVCFDVNSNDYTVAPFC